QIREAIIDVTDSNARVISPPVVIRGPDAPPAPARSTPLKSRLTRFAFESKALGETRRGTIYVPAASPDAPRLPVIYLADGATFQFAPILEAAVRDGRASPAIIVGIDSADGFVPDCGKPYCDRRNLDYQSSQEAGETRPDPQFTRHLNFVADELVPWIEANYPASSRRQDRIVAGYSSGAAWAFAAAALRPDLFGNVLGMSAGSAATMHHAEALGNARIYTGAGTFEPTFLASTRERARRAKAAGAEVRFREVLAGHSMAMWDILFAEGISWLLPSGR
ncbi:MAG: alpha/beta hydrolase-fold protein, partial [Pseudomonadota bacterium]|nr:alpha/beta hydrolase-fold protein [Pseudomonadota bacterium]